MLVYYLHLFRDKYWPDGQLGPARAARSDDVKLQTRLLAKEKFSANIPEVVTNLVGEHNARRGAIKTFEVLQEYRLNKHLFLFSTRARDDDTAGLRYDYIPSKNIDCLFLPLQLSQLKKQNVGSSHTLRLLMTLLLSLL